MENKYVINNKYRVKRQAMLLYGTIYKVCIWFHVGQIWELITSNRHIVKLSRNNVTVEMERFDFEEYFEEVKE